MNNQRRTIFAKLTLAYRRRYEIERHPCFLVAGFG